MNKTLEHLNYFVYDSDVETYTLDRIAAKEIVDKLNEKDMDILKMYDLVFQDMVKCYLENMEEEDRVKIAEEEIKEIAYKMIYKNEYLWEIINDTIDNYLGDILVEEEVEDDE